MTDQSVWANELYEFLVERGVTIFSYVPDAGHKVMIERSMADPEILSVPLTSEEEGVALAVGAPGWTRVTTKPSGFVRGPMDLTVYRLRPQGSSRRPQKGRGFQVVASARASTTRSWSSWTIWG